MQVIKSTGLVPVKGLIRTQHKAGAVFGVIPALARAGVEAGTLELYPVPEGTETFEVSGPGPVVKKDAAAAVKLPDTAPRPPVVIPDLWDAPRREGGLQWMQIVKLAEAINGGALVVPEGQKPKEYAEAIIRDELARRAAAESTPQA